MSDVIEAADRFRPDAPSCQFCPRPATVVHLPSIDHRRRRQTWPRTILTCSQHVELPRDGGSE